MDHLHGIRNVLDVKTPRGDGGFVDWSITYFVCVKIEFQIPSRDRVAQPAKGSRGLSLGEMRGWQGGDGVSAERKYTCFQQ